MNDWTSGYVADIGYTFGYYLELNPLHQRLALLNAGLAVPETAVACEIGFGQGLSTNIHAAASDTQWWGTDFNSSQASFARDLASAAGTGARLFDQAFSEFCTRPDLPDFDVIGLHGIWSWVSNENRAVIVNFIRRKLKTGGVVYISYNTQPGWAAMAPMRHLLSQHAAVMGAPGQGSAGRIDAALKFSEEFLAVNPLFVQANPHIVESMRKISKENRNYLAHEYFNRHWQPMPYAETMECLLPAKLDYACSARYLDHIDALNLSAEQQQFLGRITDSGFRETVRDYLINQRFRRDYWVKGSRKISALDQAEAFRAQAVILIMPRADVPLKVAGAFAMASLQQAVYGPILDALSDHQSKTLGRIEQEVKGLGITFAQVRQAVITLIGSGGLQPAQPDSLVTRARSSTDRFNAHVISKARGGDDIRYLASPVTGGGIPVPRFHQLFLLARAQGKESPEEWAAFVWERLSNEGRRIVKNGKTLATADENLADLADQARNFADRLPVLKALQVV